MITLNKLAIETGLIKSQPFDCLPSSTKGRVVSNYAQAILSLYFDVSTALNKKHDFILNSSKIEFKSSRIWNTGEYKFQQIRSQGWDYLIAIGIYNLSPDVLHWYACTYQEAIAISDGQHGGNKSNIKWLPSIQPGKPHPILGSGNFNSFIKKLKSFNL